MHAVFLGFQLHLAQAVTRYYADGHLEPVGLIRIDAVRPVLFGDFFQAVQEGFVQVKAVRSGQDLLKEDRLGQGVDADRLFIFVLRASDVVLHVFGELFQFLNLVSRSLQPLAP